jgi:flagellar basal body rod protein FlgG
MIQSYYTAINGAKSNQENLNVISNNMANIQTEGFKKSKAEFSELLYSNIKNSTNEAVIGSGSKLNKVDVVFAQGPIVNTGRNTDFAITGDGFFQVQFGEITKFTRDGNFDIANVDGENFLLYQGGYVLDSDENPIIIEDKNAEVINVGLFQFENNENLVRSGNNLYHIENENANYSASQSQNVLRGYLEQSSVDITEEMINLLKSQRSFQLNSKIIQTADEIEQTINSLKN